MQDLGPAANSDPVAVSGWVQTFRQHGVRRTLLFALAITVVLSPTMLIHSQTWRVVYFIPAFLAAMYIGPRALGPERPTPDP